MQGLIRQVGLQESLGERFTLYSLLVMHLAQPGNKFISGSECE